MQCQAPVSIHVVCEGYSVHALASKLLALGWEGVQYSESCVQCHMGWLQYQMAPGEPSQKPVQIPF